jgi:hypothetical protein
VFANVVMDLLSGFCTSLKNSYRQAVDFVGNTVMRCRGNPEYPDGLSTFVPLDYNNCGNE